MADLITELEYTVALDAVVSRVKNSGAFVRGDSAQHIVLTVMRGAEAADLTGMQALVWFVLSNGVSPFVVGTIADNIVTAEVTAECTAVAGRLYIQLQLSDTEGHTQTPIIIETHIVANAGDAVVDTGNVLPSISALLAQVEACKAATQEANTATGNANTAKDAAQDAADAIIGITMQATTLESGQPATATPSFAPEDGHLDVALGLPRGDRGSRPWYGTAITGTSTTPAAYATNLTLVQAGDTYVYTGTDTANAGNEYICTLGGDAATALWRFLRNSRGMAGAGNVSFVNGVSPDVDKNVAITASDIPAGTGSDVQADLDAKASGKTHTATLPTSGWSGTGPYTYAASVADVTADNMVLAGPAPASKAAYEDCGAYPSAQGAGTLTFTAESVPAEEITVNVLILDL